MLKIRLLGQFDVRAAGQRIGIPTRTGQSLLAYLILNAGTPQRRERLAEQLVVSINTIKTQLKNIYAKLEVHSREEAVETARALNLLT